MDILFAYKTATVCIIHPKNTLLNTSDGCTSLDIDEGHTSLDTSDGYTSLDTVG
uniref:Uncharacterized protein n=1 Tax=Arion vulgaris TaxID=1028688 RepID=A0A0B6ZRW9_9EUPU